MKAKFVFENIRFERGQDPKDALDIGEKWLRLAYQNGYDLSLKSKVLDAIENELFKNSKSFSVTIGSGELRNLQRYVFNDFKLDSGSNEDLVEYLISTTLPVIMKRYKIHKISESQNFERGIDPKKSLNIGVEAQINNAINDEDTLYDIINHMDEILGGAMEVYLPEDKKKEIARMWLSNNYESLPHYEFKILYQSTDDEPVLDDDGEIIESPIDYEVSDLESEGWEVFHEEDNFGEVQIVLTRET